jgi:hypothetical protein
MPSAKIGAKQRIENIGALKVPDLRQNFLHDKDDSILFS